MSWFTELFINQVKPALEYHSGLGSGSGSDDTQMYILIDEDGNEYPAVLVEEETVFDADANDIRQGKVAATEDGVTVGTKVIPSYNTIEGTRLVMNGSKFTITTDLYDYTELQAIVCPFNTNMNNSVAAEKVVVESNVYPVQSTEAITAVTKDHENQRVDLNIVNESGARYLVRYILYKEIY